MFPWALAAAVAMTAWCAASPSPVSHVFEIDISPEEAARYLAQPPFAQPQLAGRTAQLPLVPWDSAAFRSAEAGPTRGHYWRGGHELERPDDYVEDVYEAAQYHGQDGLGGYGYGYAAPESAKVESRARSGRVDGSYTYRGADQRDVVVRYWADHDGFHQEDNLPQPPPPQPAQETDEVRSARLAHQKAWDEAAAAAALSPDPDESSYREAERSAAASELSSDYAPRDAKALHGAGGQNSYAPPQPQQYQQQQQRQQQQQQRSIEAEPEPTGPPRGFFYSFTYPVSIIVPKSEAAGHGVGDGDGRAHG